MLLHIASFTSNSIIPKQKNVIPFFSKNELRSFTRFASRTRKSIQRNPTQENFLCKLPSQLLHSSYAKTPPNPIVKKHFITQEHTFPIPTIKHMFYFVNHFTNHNKNCTSHSEILSATTYFPDQASLPPTSAQISCDEVTPCILSCHPRMSPSSD